MVSCLMGDSTALASAIVRCCLKNDRAEFIRTVQETQAAQQTADISKKRKRLAAAQKRAGELEKLICKIYEDNALGKLPDARYEALDAQYAKEQDALNAEIVELEKAVTLVTTVCVGLLLMVQGNPSLFVIGFAVAGGGICSTCLRMDETAGWTKFELTAPVSRTTVVVEKYVLLLLLTAIGLIVGGAISYVAGTVTSTLDISQFICRYFRGRLR